MPISQLDEADAIFLVGSDLRHEVPIIAHRVRKAALNGCTVDMLDTSDREYFFEHGPVLQAPAIAWCTALALVLKAAGGQNQVAGDLAEFVATAAQPSDAHRRIAERLRDASDGYILTGLMALGHPDFAAVRGLSQAIATVTGCRLGQLTAGANAAGAALAGALPHRDAAGREKRVAGKHIGQMLTAPQKALLLFGIEPEFDLADSVAAVAAMAEAGFCVAFASYMSDGLAEHADVVLPIGTFAETSGTYVNAAGDWQSFQGVALPVGECRPGWKVLRVLANRLGVPDSDFQSSEEIRDVLRAQIDSADAVNAGSDLPSLAPVADADIDGKSIETAIYDVDAVVRRAEALQSTPVAVQRTQAPARASA
jgi:NADH-quinone oxidoreductase subunit G